MSIKPTAGDGSTLEWTKSSYSTNEGADCVEIAAIPDSILVRDSKRATGPRLTFDTGVWEAFITRTTGR
ncbi:DUF397 domain-containing protein [Streptomyces sp. Z26]|uniref:DUF397 domain-containing protein n=1 Tax=Streptomyces sp. Z26 TaxID=2500177 RepID=UPI000EF14FAE|nr:DUF397 domain-containing protein [Streptomyces sp. Z26]RLL69674.1 DUF397 domain-containing protein [Streptomyces sp. Z26]